MIDSIIIWLIGIGMLADVVSCILLIRRNHVGHGPSGMPIVSLIACYLLPLIIFGQAVFTSSFWLDCLLLMIFHFVFLYIVPIFDRRFLVGFKS